MIGLAGVKEEVRAIIDEIQVNEWRHASGLGVGQVSQHLVFSGAPGTGKTTVARLLAKETGIAFDLVDERVKRSVAETRRALIPHGGEARFRTRSDVIGQCAEQTTFSHPRFTRQQHDLPLPTLSPLQPIEQDGQFLPPPNHWQQLRDMRIEAGREEPQLEVVDLSAFLIEVADICRPLASQKGLSFALHVPDGVSVFRTDAAKVRQILLNLLSNAVKFTPAGGTVRVAAEERREGVLLEIEDTGIGIPQWALARRGRPFEQVESQLTRSHKGSGLGLAIARYLAALHGGDMAIQSAEGVGTRVSVLLPAEPAGRPVEPA
jgi:two-component sensor histidine kinase